MCEAQRRGIQECLPVKGPKAIRPLKRGTAFVATDADGAVLLVKRPEKGLLGGMLQPPQGAWGDVFPRRDEAVAQAPFPAAWKKLPGIVRHGFTHFELEIEVWVAEAKKATGRDKPGRSVDTRWVPLDDLHAVALPTVMRKIIAHAFPDEGPLFNSRNRRP
jgi:A/G-specific adenine glycosylase